MAAVDTAPAAGGRRPRSGAGFAWFKRALFVVALVPLAAIVAAGVQGELGPNPVETVIRHFGEWALRFLVLTLAVTPLRRLAGWNQLARLRRMIGLYAFFYAALHLASYVVLDKSLLIEEVLDDLTERPYIMVGMGAFALMVPLAATSLDRAVRRLGGRRWRQLHRLAYVAAVGGVIHFWWLVKADIAEPLIYAAIFAVLFVLRLPPVVPFLRALPRRSR